ncbi:MAG: 7-cyano-7-deazaguanine synthase [Acidobacteriota bacterium]|jgi:tRNA-uridine 2-sulfurtransferase
MNSKLTKDPKSKESHRPRAVVMLSGGLDSTLAAKVLQEQGIEVHGIHFSTGFCIDDHKRAVAPAGEDPKKLRNEALRAGADLGIPVEMVDISEEYLDIVYNPKHGYGAHMNPCIDCRAFMLRKAKEHMAAIGADFIATGEVLGQRPKSQRRDAMDIVERDSGLKGKLLRPLSAKLMRPTEAEETGLVEREALLDIKGRGRRRQMDLIEEKGITDYPSPAGGCCYLTDEVFSRKFRDKMKHKGEQRMDWTDVALLKVGRHFRIHEGLKLIVGRNERENQFLERFTAGRVVFEPIDVKGPIAVSDESLPSADDENLCAALVARFSDGKKLPQVAVAARGGSQDTRTYNAAPLWDEDQMERLRI